MLKARETILNLKEYHPPLGNRDGLRLDFNENTAGCSPRVLERLRQMDAETLARYPQREPAERIVAQHFSISADELLLTNGTDEAIHLVCETFLEPGDEALIVVPTFAMFEIYASATGARVISIPAEHGFQFPAEAVVSRITRRTRFIAVANPNNPTGGFAKLDDLARIATAAPNAALLIDEAYFEFCGKTMLRRWHELPNLFVTRTFSKAYGLAGLRIGVLMGNAEQMRALRRASSPYNLNAVALACLPEAIADQSYVQNYAAQVIAGRRELEAQLAAWSVRYWPSQANFVLFYLGENCKPFIEAMRKRGLLVRDRSNDYGCKDCIRITLGTREHNSIMLSALREVFAKPGIREQVAQ